MAKKIQSENKITLYNPHQQYRSIEGQAKDWVIEKTEPTIRNTYQFTKQFIPSFLDKASMVWRLPSEMRRNRNGQDRPNLQDNLKLTKAEKLGNLVGDTLGVAASIGQGFYAVGGSLIGGDYSTEVAHSILRANAISGAYEVGRFNESRSENKRLIPQIKPRGEVAAMLDLNLKGLNKIPFLKKFIK